MTERNTKQRKLKEGIASEKLMFRGEPPLKNYDHPDNWETVILKYVRLEPLISD